MMTPSCSMAEDIICEMTYMDEIIMNRSCWRTHFVHAHIVILHVVKLMHKRAHDGNLRALSSTLSDTNSV